jgi:hypothetical protein
MPLRHVPVVEWPAALAPLLQEAQITSSSDGKRVCRIDVDVDAQTLLTLHEFEAHLRRRLVQLRLPADAECMTGEMVDEAPAGVMACGSDESQSMILPGSRPRLARALASRCSSSFC